MHNIVHPEGGKNGEEDQVCRLIIHPTAAGKVRGSHNCGKCDKEVAAAIERYSVSGDLNEFGGLNCMCKEVWKHEVALDAAVPVPLGVGINRRGPLMERLRSP